ncbi:MULTISPECIES: SgcJ/EcaC family oxidoreductase [Actinomadura]|uniref:SgcJ/EcaC family oxidoreductase n=1 Tax=Actinomadura yumaensis TaxID=111807 RepID=A0ABW2CIW4_9ACTN|nr:SgcJ/EcaC family oxidoreductase [Actinomadura sp. J1-007]MWK38572.1 SgcJ/EcaC family oxidoreductase [Actinomadura sp. J1-007]
MPIEKALNRRLENAWNAGDGQAWAANFAEDADFVDALGRHHHGREEIEASAQHVLDTIYQGSSITFRHTGSRTIGDMMIMHNTSLLHVPNGPLAGDIHSTQTLVLDAEQIIAFQNTIQQNYEGYANGKA